MQMPETLKRDRKNPMYNDYNKNSTSLKINKKKHSKKNRKDRSINNIVMGCNSKPGAIPWQVILADINCATLCGGTQINLRFILTAAHCIDAFKKNPRKYCPRKIPKKKILQYPHNIQSKYVLYCTGGPLIALIMGMKNTVLSETVLIGVNFSSKTR